MKMNMTNEERLKELYKIRAELQSEADRRFQMGIGELYTDELKKIDEQIHHFEDLIPPITPLIPAPNYQPTMADILKEAIGDREIRDRDHQQRLQREAFKQQRILNSREDRRIQALNVIIEHIEPYYSERKHVTIDYHYFNYEDLMDDSKLFERFLDSAKEEGCFESFGRTNNTRRIEFGFNGVDLDNIKKFKDKLQKSIQSDDRNKSYPNSLHLVSTSLEPASVIWLVLDERFEMPIRCATKNNKGDPLAIKKLYDIAYIVDVPNKKVSYDKNIADSINNGLFRKRPVAKYMKTNKLEKPTLVQKSENNTLVLRNDIPVKTILVKNIPIQHQSLYIDKTK